VSDTDLREEVRSRYAEAAIAVATGAGAACDCCHPGRTCAEEGHAFGPELYEALASEELPDAAVLASLGCGNPIAVADLHEGETVLDLGSGGGIDVLLSAKRVGPTGKVYGLDMTEEMLALAIRNRDLCPGGRVGVSDVVADDELSPEQRAERGTYVGCIAGALSFTEYEEGLRAAGFEDITITSTDEPLPRMHSAIVQATKGAERHAAAMPMRTLPVVQDSCC
jgi:arsenite methyltransferase